MGSVSVDFLGVCVHFKFGVAAGVPHRVVLPNATTMMGGLLTVENADPPMTKPVLYYLIPHFPQIDLVPPNVPLTVPNLMTDGDIFSGARLQIANAVDEVMTYDGDVFKLTDYDPDYNFSSDVVVNGNALCYFDFFGGRFSPFTGAGGAVNATILVQTDGPPRLLVSPLTPTGVTPARSFTIPLALPGESEDVTLVVKNLEPPDIYNLGVDQQGGYDLLLSYLTARGGIPETITKLTPGMVPPLNSATKVEVGGVLVKIGDYLLNGDPTDVRNYIRRILMPEDQVTASCSDTQYP
jgi:hypothetical protein